MLDEAKRICDEAQILPWPWAPRFTMDCDRSLVVMGTLLVLTITLYSVYNSVGYHKRKAMEHRLELALRTVCDLEEKLLSLEANDLDSIKKTGREIRIFMDGAFDMMHFGHMNAFRQARALGTYLIAGVNSSETITKAKGAPVYDDDERCATVGGCKWVDEVVRGVPYVMNDEYLSYIIEKYKVDYVVHGDDPCIVDGRDCYEGAQKLGKYLTIPRTEGISTTDIVGRMLLLSKDHHISSPTMAIKHSCSHPLLTDQTPPTPAAIGGKLVSDKDSASNPYFRKSNFLATSRILRLFGAGVKAPKVSDKVVYLAGGWDMFHAGHIATLEKARQLGDYVIVGVHNDYEVNRRRGLNYPIMSLHERVLSVLGCKWVDDVLIDAPYAVTQDMIASLRINVVVKGTVTDSTSPDGTSSSPPRTPPRGGSVNSSGDVDELNGDPFAIPRKMNILRVVHSSQELTVSDIVGRIHVQKEHFDRKFAKKKAAEDEYYDVKYGRR